MRKRINKYEKGQDELLMKKWRAEWEREVFAGKRPNAKININKLN